MVQMRWGKFFRRTMNVAMIAGAPYVGMNLGLIYRSRDVASRPMGTIKVLETNKIKSLAEMDSQEGCLYMRVWSLATLHHELRHAKNSEWGMLPQVTNEVSARVAEQLHYLTDTNRMTVVDSLYLAGGPAAFVNQDIPYDLNYMIPNLDTARVNLVLMTALMDWNLKRKYYEIQILFERAFPLAYRYIKTALMRDDAAQMSQEQKIDSAFTFLINNRRTNLLRMANPAVRHQVLDVVHKNR